MLDSSRKELLMCDYVELGDNSNLFKKDVNDFVFFLDFRKDGCNPVMYVDALPELSRGDKISFCDSFIYEYFLLKKIGFDMSFKRGKWFKVIRSFFNPLLMENRTLIDA